MPLRSFFFIEGKSILMLERRFSEGHVTMSLMVVPLASNLGISDYLVHNTFGMLILGTLLP